MSSQKPANLTKLRIITTTAAVILLALTALMFFLLIKIVSNAITGGIVISALVFVVPAALLFTGGAIGLFERKHEGTGIIIALAVIIAVGVTFLLGYNMGFVDKSSTLYINGKKLNETGEWLATCFCCLAVFFGASLGLMKGGSYLFNHVLLK